MKQVYLILAALLLLCLAPMPYGCFHFFDEQSGEAWWGRLWKIVLPRNLVVWK